MDWNNLNWTIFSSKRRKKDRRAQWLPQVELFASANGLSPSKATFKPKSAASHALHCDKNSVSMLISILLDICFRTLENIGSHPAALDPSHLPSLPELSSQRLTDLFSTLRTNVFFPATLTSSQRDLLFRKKLNHLLQTEDPIIVTRGTPPEPFQLKPLDHLRDEPGTKLTFFEMLGLMKEAGDWKIWPGLLEGWRGAGRKIKKDWIEKFARRAGERGMGNVVLECAKRADRTGVWVGDRETLTELLLGSYAIGRLEEWSDAGVERAARYVQGILGLVEELGKQKIEGDPRLRPETWATGLGFLGLRVQRGAYGVGHEGGDEGLDIETRKAVDRETVARFAARVISLRGNTNMEVYAGPRDGEEWKKAWWALNEKLVIYAPVWHGLKVAHGVLIAEQRHRALGEEIKALLDKEVAPFLYRMEKDVRDAIGEREETRGLALWTELQKEKSLR